MATTKKPETLVAYRWQCRQCSATFSHSTDLVIHSAPIQERCPECGNESENHVEYSDGTPPIVRRTWFYRLAGDKRKKKK